MVWFRRDLSLEDNLAWSQATVDHAEVLPVYVLHHRLLDAAGPYRRRQFTASLAALADELRVVGGHLTVANDDPVEAVTRLAEYRPTPSTGTTTSQGRFVFAPTPTRSRASCNQVFPSSGHGSLCIRPAPS
jgi:deoxyribodipyrimidine photolyase